jgi:hypothetical protein
MALRVMPTVGADVLIDHLGVVQRGIVASVDPDGRAVQVATEDGRVETFRLNRATARFTLHGELVGPRLRFVDGD